MGHKLFVLAWLACSVGLAGAHPSPEEQVASRKSQSESQNELVLSHGSLDLFYSPQAVEKEISIRVVGGCPLPVRCGRPSWVLSGTFTTRDAWEKEKAQSLQASGQQPPSSVVLDSQGGNVAAALMAAKYIQDVKADTIVENNGSCVSACVYVLGVGTRRTLGPWALIGVHQQNMSKSLAPEVAHEDDDGRKGYLKKLSGDKPTKTMADLIQNVDEKTSDVQKTDARLIGNFLQSGVSPALLTYAERTEHTFASTFMYVIAHRCALALRLDNSQSQEPPSVSEIEDSCGKIQ